MTAIAFISRSLAKQRLLKSLSSAQAIQLAQSSSSSFSTSAATATALSSQQPQAKERSTWSKLFLFLPGALTFGLGTWQIIRRQEKVQMLEYRKKRLEMEPMTINSLPPSNEKLDSLEFRRVLCQGIFDEKRSIYVGPRSRSISGVTENGYYLITPLMPIPNNPESVQSPVLVNRGWVPRSWREKREVTSQDHEDLSNVEPASVQKSSSWWSFGLKKPKKVEEKVPTPASAKVIGVVRGSENPSIFVPHNNPDSGEWFWVDVPAIARACGLPEDTIYIEDINEDVNPSNPYPIPKDVNSLIRYSVMPQDHLNYTLTWYSLSAAVTFMAFKRLRPKRSRR